MCPRDESPGRRISRPVVRREGKGGYVVVHERDVCITNLSRRTPASRGGGGEESGENSGLVVSPAEGGGEAAGETRKKGGWEGEEASAADRDGVDVERL